MLTIRHLDNFVDRHGERSFEEQPWRGATLASLAGDATGCVLNGRAIPREEWGTLTPADGSFLCFVHGDLAGVGSVAGNFIGGAISFYDPFHAGIGYAVTGEWNPLAQLTLLQNQIIPINGR